MALTQRGRALLEALALAGFERMEEETRHSELVYQYRLKAQNDRSEAWVRVFTSVLRNGRYRSKGSDAIRVCAVRKRGDEIVGLVPTKRFGRVYRVGTEKEISERVLERARQVYKEAMRRENARVRRGGV